MKKSNNKIKIPGKLKNTELILIKLEELNKRKSNKNQSNTSRNRDDGAGAIDGGMIGVGF